MATISTSDSPSPTMGETNETQMLEYKDTMIDVVSSGIVFVTCIIGMFLNISTIMALSHLPWSSRPNLRLVLSLCTANLFFSFNYFVYMIAYYSNPSMAGYEASCLTFEILRCVIYLFIYFNVSFIVLDIYLAVTNPLGYASIVTTSRTNKLVVFNTVVCIFIVAMAISFNCMTLKETSQTIPNESACSIYPNFKYIGSIHWIFKVTVFICIPVFIVLLIIILLAVKATQSAASRNTQTSDFRGVVNVYCVVIAFLTCFGPYQFISFYLQYSPNMYIQYKMMAHIFERMMYLYGFFAPLIYSLRMDDVKKGYKLMFKKCLSAASDYHSVLYRH